MPIAAVPNYLKQDFKGASPGLRFGLFLKLWVVNRRTNKLLWTKQDIDYEIRGRERRERKVIYDNKKPALEEASQLTNSDKYAMSALLARQRAVFALRAYKEAGLCIEAKAIAPFTTGLGNEHPLENGFAFLNPYGLPYLPGSGVKGVIRQAAQELASGKWGDSHGWNDKKLYSIEIGKGNDKHKVQLSMIDVLFGIETKDNDKDHLRGVLSFWDVIPQISGDSLMVEIMTPHYSHYYQQQADKKSGNSTSPHDSGQPNPIVYLTVPPESDFVFHVVCDTVRLQQIAQELAEKVDNNSPRWQRLLQSAFKFAFEWLGFGAKTAIGYGSMASSATVPKTTQQTKPTGNTNKEEKWENATLKYFPNTRSVKAIYGNHKTVEIELDKCPGITDEMKEKLMKKNNIKANVLVSREGNFVKIIKVL